MKSFLWLFITGVVLLVACQPNPRSVTILVDGQSLRLMTTGHTAVEMIAEADLILQPGDRVIYLGQPVRVDVPLPQASAYTLSIRRAVTMTLLILGGDSLQIQTSAQTVGQALSEAGFHLYPADRIAPPSGTPILGDLTINIRPSTEYILTIQNHQQAFRSSASTIGQALTEAGLPLTALDYSLPSESEPLPNDGHIQIINVEESITLSQNTIPYNTRAELSADLEIDQQALIQGGEPGLKISRLRTRSEDGVQVSQTTEGEGIVRPPQDQVLGIGTKIVIRTTVVDGISIEYWRALRLYATYYIPCIPGTTICHYGTSSGTRVRKGAVAFVYPWYLLFAGEQLYIPGYGFGTVEDNNGALTNAFGSTYWIDLGYSQTDDVDWDSQYVTVYFLTPVPANVADTYLLP